MSGHIERAAAELRDHTWQSVSIRGLTKCAGQFTEHMYTVGDDAADHEAHQAYWLDAAGLLASPEHDAQVAARAWAEGYGTGVHDERVAAEWNVAAARLNPYEREGGASDADT